MPRSPSYCASVVYTAGEGLGFAIPLIASRVLHRSLCAPTNNIGGSQFADTIGGCLGAIIKGATHTCAHELQTPSTQSGKLIWVLVSSAQRIHRNCLEILKKTASEQRAQHSIGFPSGIIRQNWNDTEKIGMTPAQG